MTRREASCCHASPGRLTTKVPFCTGRQLAGIEIYVGAGARSGFRDARTHAHIRGESPGIPYPPTPLGLRLDLYIYSPGPPHRTLSPSAPARRHEQRRHDGRFGRSSKTEPARGVLARQTTVARSSCSATRPTNTSLTSFPRERLLAESTVRVAWQILARGHIRTRPAPCAVTCLALGAARTWASPTYSGS